MPVNLLDIGEEANAVDRAIKYARRVDAIDTQLGQRAPVPLRGPCDEVLAARAPAADQRHIGIDPGLVDEDEAPGSILA
jgi:hypothetical protein